jgi:hypothetical protein
MRTAESVVLTDWPPGPDLDVVGLGQHRHRGRRGVDPALGLGRRHALHAVHPGLPLEDRVGAVALDLEGHRLEPADLVRRGRELLDLEAPLGGVAGEHAVDVAGEQRGLVTAGAGANLDDHVAVVVRVALEHGHAELLLETR